MNPHIRRIITVIALLVVAALTLGCASTSRNDTTGWDNRPGDDCPTVVVENRAFADVVVRHQEVRQFRENVTGLTTETFQDCALLDKAPTFHIDAVGDRFAYPLRGVNHLGPGSTIHLVIAMHPRSSYVIGQGFDAPGDSLDLRLKGLAITDRPLGIHRGIFEDVVSCLEITGEPYVPAPLEDLIWGISSEILDMNTRRLMYGAFIDNPRVFPFPLIVLEYDYVVHPTVISHEILHYLGHTEAQVDQSGCLMDFPGVSLPGRYSN